jgi:hypothetical protein
MTVQENELLGMTNDTSTIALFENQQQVPKEPRGNRYVSVEILCLYCRRVDHACEAIDVRIREEPPNQMSGSVQDKPDPKNDGKERLKVKANNCLAFRKGCEESDCMVFVTT